MRNKFAEIDFSQKASDTIKMIRNAKVIKFVDIAFIIPNKNIKNNTSEM